MKAKQELLKAVFTEERSNAKNYGNEKEKVSQYLILDKKTERVVVDCRVYMGRSASAITVYASMWINLQKDEKPAHWEYAGTSGTGNASGYGYHRESAAIAHALDSAGVQLFGEVYSCAAPTDPKEAAKHKREIMKKRAYIDGVGESAIKKALLAVAHAAGFNDVIFINA